MGCGAGKARRTTREQAAAIFPVASRSLRTWVAQCEAEGIDGLGGARGGRGRRPAVPDEEIGAAIKKGTESGGF